jgi:hypothetical protein
VADAQLGRSTRRQPRHNFRESYTPPRAVGAGERQPLAGEMEQRRISEPDWKVWRRLHTVALDRYCQKVLRDAAKLETDQGTAHERYVKLYQLVKRTDKKIGEIFDGPSRSGAYFKIAAARHARVLTDDEIAEFSEETQSVVAFLLGGLG